MGELEANLGLERTAKAGEVDQMKKFPGLKTGVKVELYAIEGAVSK